MESLRVFSSGNGAMYLWLMVGCVMDEFKGTQGPWELLAEEVDKPYIRVRGTVLGGRFKIANVLTPVYEGSTDREIEETMANARLVVAAPELLEALHQITREYIRTRCQLNGDSAEEMESVTCVMNARKAINKALGK